MKAAMLHAIATPLVIEEVPTPAPGPGQVLIRTEACGVCHSDLHLAEGDWDLLRPVTKIPLILGHEVAGTVSALGEGVSGVKVGDRVGVPWIHWTCGECEFCKEGREELCLKQKVTGCTVDGGFAEYLLAPATHASPLPASLSAIEAAPLLCAGLTVYKAMKASGIAPGQRHGDLRRRRAGPSGCADRARAWTFMSARSISATRNSSSRNRWERNGPSTPRRNRCTNGFDRSAARMSRW